MGEYFFGLVVEDFAVVAANEFTVVVEVGLLGLSADVGVVDDVVLAAEPLRVHHHHRLLRGDQFLLDVDGDLEVYRGVL